MIQKEVIEYIVRCLNAGKDEKFIKNSLIRAGHNRISIERAYNYVKKRDNKISPPRKNPFITPIPIFEKKTPTPQENWISLGTANKNQDVDKKNSNKKLLLTLMVSILIIAIIVGIVLLINKSSISESDMNNGISFNLAGGENKGFYLKGEKHTIGVNEVYPNYVEFTIRSSPLSFSLDVGDEKILNLDGDEYYDLEIKLIEIKESVPVIFLKKSIEKVCTEQWTCEDWSNCSESGIQTRLCEDSNNCGTYDLRPDLSRNCFYEGEPCVEDWNCTGWGICNNGTQTRECIDLNECNIIINKPDEEQNCTILDYIDCGEITNSMSECFINNSKDCTRAKLFLNVKNVTDPLMGMIDLNYGILLHIEGWNETNCSHTQEFLYYSQEFSEGYIQLLLSQNLTMENITTMEKEVNETSQEILNNYNYCLTDPGGFTSSLESMLGLGIENNSECEVKISIFEGLTYSYCKYADNSTSESYCWSLSN